MFAEDAGDIVGMGGGGGGEEEGEKERECDARKELHFVQ